MLTKALRLVEGILKTKTETATAEYRSHLRTVRSKAPPLRIELVASQDTSWLDGAAVRPAVEFLLQSGFLRAGVVAIKGNPRLLSAGFAAPQHGALAGLVRAGDNAFLSLTSHFTDGGAFECTNMPVPFEAPYPDWFGRRRRAGVSAPELWSGFLAERPPKALTSVTPECFAESNADDYFRYQAWLAERGGFTRAELAARFKAAGKLPAGVAGENLLNQARLDELERSHCNWWRLQSAAPYPLEQVLESLIIVHDELTPEMLVNAYWCASNDFKARDAEFANGAPREAFARVVASRGGLLRKVFEKRTPLFADFYLPVQG